MVAGTKKLSRSRSDRISRLPDSILENILTYLPLQEAVRTSILSTRWRVSVSSGDFLSNFISSCTLLERLTLEDLEYYHLDIIAPKLKFFKFVGFFWSIALKSTTHLEELSIHMLLRIPRTEDEDGRSAPTIFFDNLSVIKLLKLNGGAMKHMFMDGVPDSLSKVLLDLEAIYLYEIFSWLNIGTINVLSLLKSFPNLEKITILAGDLKMETELQDSEESDLYLNRLLEVKMVCVGGTLPELMLIEILLARSPKLVRMFIESDPEFVEDGGLMILKALAHFRRASPMAQITFDEDQV